MTPQDVKNKVQEVRNALATRDNEDAHEVEDQLLIEVLTEISAGTPHAAELAAEALRVQEIEYDRWYA